MTKYIYRSLFLPRDMTYETNQGDNLGDFIDSSDNQRANDKYLKEFKELKERQAKQSLNSTVRSNQLDQTVIDDSVLGF